MGIPYFYRSIIDKYPKLILDSVKQDIDNLYFDLNCLIHPVSGRFYKEEPFPEDHIVFKAIVDEIVKIVNYCVTTFGDYSIIFHPLDVNFDILVIHNSNFSPRYNIYWCRDNIFS